MTANGLGSPLVIKHMRQEEEQGGKLVQHDQWYWSMVSMIVIVNGTGTAHLLSFSSLHLWFSLVPIRFLEYVISPCLLCQS